MKQTRVATVLGLCVMLAGLGVHASAIEPSPNLYYVQLGTFADYDAAQARLASLEQLSMQPLRLRSVNDQWEIHFGEFPYCMDAHLYLEDLKKVGYTDAEIVKVQNADAKTTFSQVRGPREKIFNIVEAAGGLEPCFVNVEDPDVVAISNLLKTGSTEQIHAALLERLGARQDDDPVKGWLSLRMAYIKHRMKDAAVSRQLFQQVAEGKVAAPPELRAEAMIRIAHMIHAQKERTRAYRAYKEISELAQTPQQRADAVLELSGLMMELARSDKGTLAECRAFYANTLPEIPDSFSYHKATIELMHLESWYYNGNYSRCIDEAEPYLQKYPQAPAETIAQCRMFLGMAYYKLERYEDAVSVLSEVLNLPLPPKGDAQADRDLKKRALTWLIHVAENTGHAADAAEWKEMMKTLYP